MCLSTSLWLAARMWWNRLHGFKNLTLELEGEGAWFKKEEITTPRKHVDLMLLHLISLDQEINYFCNDYNFFTLNSIYSLEFLCNRSSWISVVIYTRSNMYYSSNTEGGVISHPFAVDIYLLCIVRHAENLAVPCFTFMVSGC